MLAFNRRMRLATDAAGIGIWDLDLKADTLDWDGWMCRVYGVDADRFHGSYATWQQYVHPDDLKETVAKVDAAIHGGEPLDTEFRIVRPDGEIRYIKANALTIQNEAGQPIRLTGTNYDITESRKAQIALQASEERFALAMQGSNDGVFDWDVKTNRAFYSPRWKLMLGYAEDELENDFSVWERLVEPHDRERSWSMMRDYMAGHRDSFHIEFRMCHKDGHWVDILSRAFLVRDDDGEPVRVVGTHVDISEKKLAEREISEARERAEQYLNVAGVMLLALDLDGQITLINPKGCEILEATQEAVLGCNWFESFIPQSSSEKVQGLFRQIIDGKLDPVQFVDDQVCTAKGNKRIIAWSNSILRDNDGTIVGTLSSGEDVTERRQAENALTEERAFLQHVMDGIEDPILVIDKDFRVLRMNRIARESAQQARLDETCVKCHQISHHSDLPCSGDDHPCPLAQVLETGLPSKTIHQHPGPNGHPRTYEVAASPLRNDDGDIIGIIEASRDITDHLALLGELKEQQLSYAHLAQHDILTELPNRLLFTDRLSQTIHHAHRNKNRFAVLFIDLDRFKQINDSFDHSYGDEVLKSVAHRFQTLLREDDTIARMGGDEFTVILRHIQHEGDAARVARKILDILKQPFELQGHSVFLGASIGISVYPQHGETVDNLVRNADAAMYRAKKDGRNTYQYYTEDLTASAFERVLLEANLHHAIEREELVLHYQPQLNLMTGKLSGLEALVRWRHPDMGLVSPAKFIPLAEETGLIIEMGEWILFEACRQMTAWQQKGLVDSDTMMSVNLSARQFDHGDLIEVIERVLDDTGLKSHCLELEVTESTMMQSAERSAKVLQQMREVGIKVAIDDFGTGYSSLNYLKRMPLTKLKIDQSFVSDIPEDTNDMAIAKAVIALGDSLSLEILAEGIETDAQKAFLAQEGCHSGQGYLFSKPLSAADLEAYIQSEQA